METWPGPQNCLATCKHLANPRLALGAGSNVRLNVPAEFPLPISPPYKSEKGRNVLPPSCTLVINAGHCIHQAAMKYELGMSQATF